MSYSFSSLSSPPALPEDLIQLFDALPEDNKRLFLKLYKYLWDMILPYSRLKRSGGLIYSYWIMDNICKRHGLHPGQFSLLSFIYHVSGSGSKFIHSDVVYLGSWLPDGSKHTKLHYLYMLRAAGFILRSNRSPDHSPEFNKHIRTNVFIKMTTKGIDFIKGIEKEIQDYLYNSSIDQITGKNNPGFRPGSIN